MSSGERVFSLSRVRERAGVRGRGHQCGRLQEYVTGVLGLCFMPCMAASLPRSCGVRARTQLRGNLLRKEANGIEYTLQRDLSAHVRLDDHPRQAEHIP